MVRMFLRVGFKCELSPSPNPKAARKRETMKKTNFVTSRNSFWGFFPFGQGKFFMCELIMSRFVP